MTKVNKGTIELVKTIVITILVTGIIAFVSGVVFANKLNSDKRDAVETALQVQATSVAKVSKQ